MQNKIKKDGNVPNLRFPGFEGEWEITTLGEIGDFTGGGTPKSSNIDFWKGDIPWISSSDLDENNISDIKVTRFITQEAIDSSATKFCIAPVILIVSRVGVGKVAYSNKGICTSQDFMNITNFKCDGIFLSYLLSIKMRESIGSVQGTSIKGISSGEIKSKKILIPKKEEQKKIANLVSLIDNRIQTQNKIIEGLKLLKAVISKKIFSLQFRFKDEYGNDFPKWEIKKLGDVSKIYDGTHQTPNYIDIGVKFYSVEHLTANQFKNTKFISTEVYKRENKRVKLEKGDILMTRIGSIGVAKYIDWDVAASFYVSLALIKKSNNVNNKFLCHFINTGLFQAELWKRTIHVAFPKKINLGEISECMIKLPSIPEQNKIADMLSKIENKFEIETQLLKQLEIQKQYIQTNLFI